MPQGLIPVVTMSPNQSLSSSVDSLTHLSPTPSTSTSSRKRKLGNVSEDPNKKRRFIAWGTDEIQEKIVQYFTEYGTYTFGHLRADIERILGRPIPKPSLSCYLRRWKTEGVNDMKIGNDYRFYLSNALTYHLLIIKDIDRRVYRLTADDGAIKYFRCCGCLTGSSGKRSEGKLFCARARLCEDGTLLHSTQHNDYCNPVQVDQIISDEILKQEKINIRDGKKNPGDAYNDALARCEEISMNVAACLKPYLEIKSSLNRWHASFKKRGKSIPTLEEGDDESEGSA